MIVFKPWAKQYFDLTDNYLWRIGLSMFLPTIFTQKKLSAGQYTSIGKTRIPKRNQDRD
jgi:hypothetical protein